MPFIPHTPESLIRRSDSRNPATTCKGITTSGTHCRRSITSLHSPTSILPRHIARTAKDGVLAVLEPGDGVNEGAAAFFCWQHKDQATTLTETPHGARTANVVDLKRRTSVDTLVERLGLLETDDPVKGKSRKEMRRQWAEERPARKDTLPKHWQDVEGPLLAVHARRGEKNAPPMRRKGPSFFETLCCIASPEVNPMPPSRIRWEDEKSRKTGAASGKVSTVPRSSDCVKRDTSLQQQPLHGKQAPASPLRAARPTSNPSIVLSRPRPDRDPPSQTQNLLSFIPKTLSPQTTSLLLTELAKPVSPHDEAGYIYIFWLTPASTTQPDDETASSLLSDDNNNSSPITPRRRRRSDIISTHAAHDKSNTLLLKIGRASNVQRRMNQWTRQCGHDLSLIRFYPYLPSASSTVPSPMPTSPHRGKMSSPPPSPARPVTKVPHVHKVERLIHLELADQRVKRSCDACGKEHKEWFEVRGTRAGLRDVDGVVKRWVGWAQEAG